MLPQHCFLIPVNNPTPSYSLFKMWPFVLSRDATRLSWSPIFILKPPSGPQLEMLCSQFLAKAMQSMHIFHSMVTSPGPGRMKETLYSHNIKFVEKHLTDRVLPESCYKCAINNIHSAAVAKAICDAGRNPVFGAWPPSLIYPDEENLLCISHCVLSQLRSGKFTRLVGHMQTPVLSTSCCPILLPTFHLPRSCDEP